MGWFNRQVPIDEISERLLQMSEKELLIEMILELKKVNRKCDNIARKIVVYGNKKKADEESIETSSAVLISSP
jgi:hypothetical protein